MYLTKRRADPRKIFDIMIQKSFSFNDYELRHCLNSLSLRSRIALLDELDGYLYSIESGALKRYLCKVVKGLKSEYRIMTQIEGTQSKPRKYDTMFNPVQKVLFETALAGAINEQKSIISPAINKMAIAIANLLEKTLFNTQMMRSLPNSVALLDNLYKHINSMDCCDFYNRYKGTSQRKAIPIEEIPTFMDWALNRLRDPDNANLDEKMFLIYIYTGFVSRPDRTGCSSISDVPKVLFVTDENRELLLTTYMKHKFSGKAGAFNKEGRSVSRQKRMSKKGPLKSTPEENPPQNIAGIVPAKGVRGSESLDLKSLPSDLVRLLELANPNYFRSSAGILQPTYVKEDGIPRSEDHFYDEAVYKYNLPLVGGASGGAGTYEMAMALTPDLTMQDIRYIRAYNMAMYISYGFHSLHEVCFIQKLCGSDYITGDYNTTLYPDIITKSSYLTLTQEFGCLLGLPYKESTCITERTLCFSSVKQTEFPRKRSLSESDNWELTFFERERTPILDADVDFATKERINLN